MSEKDVVENVDSPGAVSIPIASNSAKGIASFNAKDFTVNNGEVSAIWERGVPQYVGTIVGQEEGEGDLTWTVDDASLIDNRPVKIGEYIMLREDAFGFARGEVFVITGISADENFLVITDNQSVFSLQGEVGPKGDKGDKGNKGDKGDRGEQGKEGAGIKDITNIDYPHGEFENVQYDNTDGIQLSATVRFTRDDGEVYDIPATLDIPVIPGYGILIDKVNNKMQVEVKVDSSKVFNIINNGGTSNYNRVPYLQKGKNTLSTDTLELLYVDDGNTNDIGDIPSYVSPEFGDTRSSTAVLITSDPTRPYQAANKNYVDNGFVAKVTTSTQDIRVYGLRADGTQAVFPTSQNVPELEHIAQYTTGGNIRTNTPIDNLDCANKKYVDDNIAAQLVGVKSLDGQTGALTTKTLFGTNSILGTGNIDLYKHVINFSFEDSNFNMVVYSSKSLTVDSLTDLKTLIGDYATENVSGLIYDGASSLFYPIIKINTETLEVFYVHTQNGLASESLSDYTITDTVTTI